MIGNPDTMHGWQYLGCFHFVCICIAMYPAEEACHKKCLFYVNYFCITKNLKICLWVMQGCMKEALVSVQVIIWNDILMAE